MSLLKQRADLLLKPRTIHKEQLSYVRRCSTIPCRAQGGEQVARAAPNTPSVVTDAAVPEGHQSLHTSLYGSGDAAEAHQSAGYQFREGEDDGSTLIPVSTYLSSRDGEKPLGVYAVYDEKRNLQFVGYSRNIVLAVKGHLSRVGEDRCAHVKPMVFANKAMASRRHMEALAETWLEEAGVIPPGNGVEAELWLGGISSSSEGSESPSVDLSLLSSAERAEYEEKKLKLRKAMGESLHDDQDTDESAKQRRLALIAAVHGDDWSEVISDQTQKTLEAAAAAAAGSGRQGGRQPGAQESNDPAASAAAGGGDVSGAGQIVSPFTQPTVHRQVGEQHKVVSEAPDMTVETVDKALDEVRPYLLADGGDVTVVAVQDGMVAVELQGACSSCASSSATLKMGIERQLKAVFGEQLKEVIQVDSGGGKPQASVESIDLHLNMLRSAIANLGGAVEVVSVGSGVAVLYYKGPAALGKGVTAAVKDAFPEVKEVVLKEFPAQQ